MIHSLHCTARPDQASPVGGNLPFRRNSWKARACKLFDRQKGYPSREYVSLQSEHARFAQAIAKFVSCGGFGLRSTYNVEAQGRFHPVAVQHRLPRCTHKSVWALPSCFSHHLVCATPTHASDTLSSLEIRSSCGDECCRTFASRRARLHRVQNKVSPSFR